MVGADSSLRKTPDDLVTDLIEREALAPEEITVLVCDAGMIVALAPEGSWSGVRIQDDSQEGLGAAEELRCRALEEGRGRFWWGVRRSWVDCGFSVSVKATAFFSLARGCPHVTEPIDFQIDLPNLFYYPVHKLECIPTAHQRIVELLHRIFDRSKHQSTQHR